MPSDMIDRLRQGEVVFGTWSMLPTATVPEVLGHAGLDFVVLDLEHGLINPQELTNMVRACEVSGTQGIVRTSDSRESAILQALETGSRAVLIPHVENAELAQVCVAASRYAPIGSRGLSPYTRCHGYTHEKLLESVNHHSSSTMVGVLVEGRTGLDNLEAIVRTPGLDLVYLGIYDLSQSLGVSGDLSHPSLEAALRHCARTAQLHGVAAGTFVRTVEDAQRVIDYGYTFVAYLSDSAALLDFYSSALRSLKAP